MTSDRSQTIPKPIFILQSSKPVTTVHFSAIETDILYSGNRDGLINIYNLQLRRSVFNLNPGNESILSFIELDNHNVLAYGRNGSIYKLTKSNTSYEFKCEYNKEAYTFCQIAASHDKNSLFIPSPKSSLIDCLETNTYQKINTFNFNADSEKLGLLMNIKTIDSTKLMAGFESGDIIVFDIRTFQEVSRVNLYAGQPLMCFDYSVEKNLGIAGSSENSLEQFKMNENSVERSGSIEITNPGLNSIKIRQSDSKIFATGGWDSRIRLFGSKKKNLLAVLDFHKDHINTIDFSVKNSMAAGSNDGIISFWDLYN